MNTEIVLIYARSQINIEHYPTAKAFLYYTLKMDVEKTLYILCTRTDSSE